MTFGAENTEKAIALTVTQTCFLQFLLLSTTTTATGISARSRQKRGWTNPGRGLVLRLQTMMATARSTLSSQMTRCLSFYTAIKVMARLKRSDLRRKLRLTGTGRPMPAWEWIFRITITTVGPTSLSRILPTRSTLFITTVEIPASLTTVI